jgi:hypothetical protein
MATFSCFSRRITPSAVDQIACWIVGALLLLACTVLTVKMALELSRGVVVGLWTSVVVGWGVLACDAWVIGRRTGTRSRA